MYSRAFRPDVSMPGGFVIPVLPFPPERRVYRISRIDFVAGGAGINGIDLFALVRGSEEDPGVPTDEQGVFLFPRALLSLPVANGSPNPSTYGQWDVASSLFLIGYGGGTAAHDVGVGIEYTLFKPEPREFREILGQ